jgi:hypothetical protein
MPHLKRNMRLHSARTGFATEVVAAMSMGIPVSVGAVYEQEQCMQEFITCNVKTVGHVFGNMGETTYLRRSQLSIEHVSEISLCKGPASLTITETVGGTFWALVQRKLRAELQTLARKLTNHRIEFADCHNLSKGLVVPCLRETQPTSPQQFS